MKMMYKGVIISLSFQLSILHCLLVPLFLLVLDVLVTVVEDTHAPIQNNVELVAIVTLSEDEISLGKVFILHHTADLSEMLVVDLSLLKEVVLFDIGNKLVQIFIVSSLKVLFQDCYYTLQNDR
jgi:hypothetical protein